MCRLTRNDLLIRVSKQPLYLLLLSLVCVNRIGNGGQWRFYFDLIFWDGAIGGAESFYSASDDQGDIDRCLGVKII